MTVGDFLRGNEGPYVAGGRHRWLDDVLATRSAQSRGSPTEIVAARERLELHVRAAPGDTLLENVPGLVPTYQPPRHVIRLAEDRAAPARRLLDALQDEPLRTGGKPFVPRPAKLPAAEAQVAEKMPLSGRTLKVGGDTQRPQLVGVTTDMDALHFDDASDSVLALLGEITLRGLANVVAEAILAQAEAVADLGAAVRFVADAFQPTHIVASEADWLDLSPAPWTDRLAGMAWLQCSVGPFVLGRSGCWLASTPVLTWTIGEPGLGGLEIGCFGAVAMDVAEGAAAVIGTPRTE